MAKFLYRDMNAAKGMSWDRAKNTSLLQKWSDAFLVIGGTPTAEDNGKIVDIGSGSKLGLLDYLTVGALTLLETATLKLDILVTKLLRIAYGQESSRSRPVRLLAGMVGVPLMGVMFVSTIALLFIRIVVPAALATAALPVTALVHLAAKISQKFGAKSVKGQRLENEGDTPASEKQAQDVDGAQPQVVFTPAILAARRANRLAREEAQREELLGYSDNAVDSMPRLGSST